MPDDQTVLHYQSIFDQKTHLNFLALDECKIAGIVFKTCTISEQQITPKVLSVADFCHNDENSINGKDGLVENPHPLARDRMQKHTSRGKFLCKSPGMCGGSGYGKN